MQVVQLVFRVLSRHPVSASATLGFAPLALDQGLGFAGYVLRRSRPHFGLLNLPLEFAASLFLVEVKEPVSLDVEVGGW